MAENGSVVIKIKGDDADFRKALGGLAKTATVAIAGAGTALAGLGAAAVKVGSSFESSMSQVAATMGLTVEEIHNGSEAYRTLSEAAKEAGATTKYSATQAAEALNYLALAGYDAEKSAAALPSVLNLAAAGGLDLAYASDLATDAMAALGIEASAENLTKFGDEMAMAASKANYSVAQLGEAILTVGGTAKKLKGGTVELNAALGVLANRGIKGAEGGTALRNMILSLTAPTDKAAATMKQLGVSAFDAEGNLRPLNEVFKDLDTAMASMNDEQKTGVLNDIFNKVDLKSAEAMLAGCGKEFSDLSAAIADSGGAMQNMADVQMDNLKGQMTILGSSLEGLGIQVYEKFETPLKEAAKTAIDAVGNISRSMKSGKLSDSVDKLAKSVGNLMSSVASFAGKVLPKAIDGAAAIIDHADTIRKSLIAAAVAVGTFKSVSALNNVVKGWRTAAKAVEAVTIAAKAAAGAETMHTVTLTAKQAVVGALTGKIGLLTAAQAAYNAVVAACPIGLLIAGAAALVVGIGTLISATEAETDAARESREMMERATGAIEDQLNARKALRESTQESMDQSLSEIDYAGRLIRQLEDLHDANGLVKEGYENRAKALTEQINDIIPGAIRMTEAEGRCYIQAADNLEVLMEKKRMNAILTAKEEEYTEAIKSQMETDKEMLQLQDTMAAKKAELIALQEALNAASASGSTHEYAAAAENVARAQEEYAQLEECYRQWEEVRRENYETIDEYNTLLALSQSNSLEEMQEGLREYTYRQTQVTDETKDQMEQRLESIIRHGQLAVEQAKANGYNIGEAETASLLAAKKDFESAIKEYADSGKEIPKELQQGVAATAELYAEAVAELNEKGILELEKAEAEMESIGKYCTEGFAEGILSPEAVQKVIAAAERVSAAAERSMKSYLGVRSPARKLRDEVGKMASAGVAVGITDGAGAVMRAAASLAEGIVGTFKATEAVIPFARRTAKAVGVLLTEEQERIHAELKAIQEAAINEQAEEELRQYKEKLAEKQKQLNAAEKKNRQKIREEIAKIEDEWNRKQAKAAKDAARKAEQDALNERLKALKDFQSDYEKALADIERKQDSLQSKLSGFGNLFERVKDAESEKELFQLGDIDADIRKLKHYEEAIDRLKEKGLSDGLLSEIIGMGVEDALDYMDKLNSMSDTKLDAYIAKFEEKQQLSADIAKRFYQGEKDAAEQAHRETMRDMFGVLGDEAVSAMQDSSGEFQSVGEMMMEGVSKGIEDGKSGVVKAVADAMAAAVARAREDLDIHSPSRVFAAIGDYMAQGVGVGWIRRMRTVSNDIGDSLSDGLESRLAGVYGRIQASLHSGMDRITSGMTAVQSKLGTAGITNHNTHNDGDVVFHVEHFHNDNRDSVPAIARELEFNRRRRSAAKGGVTNGLVLV